jgi:hypothetical protein
MQIDSPDFCQYLIKQMKHGFEPAGVRCDVHPQLAVGYFDANSQSFKCGECAIPQDSTKINREAMEKTQQKLREVLVSQ